MDDVEVPENIALHCPGPPEHAGSCTNALLVPFRALQQPFEQLYATVTASGWSFVRARHVPTDTVFVDIYCETCGLFVPDKGSDLPQA